MEKRAALYQTKLTFAQANDIESFTLPENADGFTLRARPATAVLRFFIERKTKGGIVDGIDGNTILVPATELASATGVYTTIPAGESYTAERIWYNKPVKVHVRSSVAGTVELSIRV